ncbi:MAG: class I SAM-dependent methyltransferase [Alphaproteobacteria bacterium]
MAGKVGEEHWGAQTSYRAKRLRRFVEMADAILKRQETCRVIDLGGNRDYWLDLEPVWAGRKLSFVLVNLQPERLDDARFEAIQGDCRNMSAFADMSFDIVHSNSLLEHVGRWKDMVATAGEIRRLAPHYFVQTPNYWFPMEPHFRSLFFHWLPEPMRIAKVMRRGLGAFPKAETVDDAARFIEDSNLLDARRFMHLFPDGRLERERVFGLTKSLIATR